MEGEMQTGAGVNEGTELMSLTISLSEKGAKDIERV